MDSDPYQYLITLSLTVCRVNSQFRCAHDWPVIYELPFGDIHSGRPWDKVCLLRAAYCCFECAHGWPVIYEVPFRDLLSWVRFLLSVPNSEQRLSCQLLACIEGLCPSFCTYLASSHPLLPVQIVATTVKAAFAS